MLEFGDVTVDTLGTNDSKEKPLLNIFRVPIAREHNFLTSSQNIIQAHDV